MEDNAKLVREQTEFEKILREFDNQLEDLHNNSEEIHGKSISFRDYGKMEIEVCEEKEPVKENEDLVSELYRRIALMKEVNIELNKAKINFRKLL